VCLSLSRFCADVEPACALGTKLSHLTTSCLSAARIMAGLIGMATLPSTDGRTRACCSRLARSTRRTGADTNAEGSITVGEHPCVRRPSSRWPGIGDRGDSTLRGAHNRLCAHRQLRRVVSAEYLVGLDGVLKR